MTQSTWLITGVNVGFGRHMTEQLLAGGNRVAGTVQKMDGMSDLKARYGDQLSLATLDITDPLEIGVVINRAFAELKEIDVVVSNTGYGLVGAAEEATDDQIRHQIDTNLLGAIRVIKTSLPHLRRQGGGHIIQTSSPGGLVGCAGGSLYSATKWAIEGFFESTALDVAHFNIWMTIVESGNALTQWAFSNTRLGAKLDVYAQTPAGVARRSVEDALELAIGDPIRMARAVIDCVSTKPSPMRIVLGSDAYSLVHDALIERLALLEAQSALAFATDFTAE